MRFHTNLPVSDIKKTALFYSTLFAAQPVKEKPDYLKYLPQAGGLNISFHQTAFGAGALEALHLGFELPDLSSLRKVRARLQEAGLAPSTRETSVCCYASQDKFWVTDPDGYRWELYVLLEDTEQKLDKKSGCCGADSKTDAVASPCC